MGYIVVSIPFLDLNNPRHANSTHGELLHDYFISARTLIALAGSIGRLILAGREMNRLAGFTARVVELINIVKDLGDKKYERTMVSNGGSNGSEGGSGVGAAQDQSLVPYSGKVLEMDCAPPPFFFLAAFPIITDLCPWTQG